jgi:hypothetical protein
LSLRVLVDGVALSDEEGRAFWARFSAYMEENKGDLAGFAKQEGYASVHPSLQGGHPVLLASRSAPQGTYRAVDKGGGSGGGGGPGAKPGGSSDHHRSTAEGSRKNPGRRKPLKGRH